MKLGSASSFRIDARAAKAELLLYGLIGQDGLGRGVSSSDVVAALNAAKDAKEITVRIHSPGGSVSEGVAIYNALKRHPARKVVHVDGVAASMASYIMLAGDRILMAANARVMIHEPRMDAESGTVDDFESGAERLRAVRQIMIEGYAARSRQSAETIAEWMADETWFNAREAVAAGFVDEIEDEMRMAALADEAVALLDQFKNTPESLRAAARSTERAMTDWVPMCFGRMCNAGSVCCQACECKAACCSVCCCSCPPDASGSTDMPGMKAAARAGAAAYDAKIINLARKETKDMKTVLAHLGLNETASEAEAVVAVSRLNDNVKALVALSGKATLDEAIGVFQGMKAAAAQNQAVAEELSKLKAEAQARAVDDLVAEAKREGRLPPAAEKSAREIGAANLAALKAFLEVLPKIGGERVEAQVRAGIVRADQVDPASVTLSVEEERMANSHSRDPKTREAFRVAMLDRKKARIAALATDDAA